MASVSSVSSSSSLYGNRNVITGLASGMDTESMIENAVSGIKTKIASLQQQKTLIEWQQEAYRSIISKMVNFSNKYADFTSSTNLLSSSFFSSAATVVTNGTYANLISASGKTSSNVQILGVKQLATAATFTVSNLGGANGSIAGDKINLDELRSTVSGTMQLSVETADGTKTISLNFGEDEVFDSTAEFADAVRAKLAETEVTVKGEDGTEQTVTADKLISVDESSDGISFGVGNGDEVEVTGVSITGATGDLKTSLGIDPSAGSNEIKMQDSDLTQTTGEYLAGKSLSFTLDGVTKTITLSDDPSDLLSNLQSDLDKAFGSGKVTSASTADGSTLQLSFSVQGGSTLSISSSDGEVLGLGGTTATSYTNTSATLGSLLGDTAFDGLDRIAASGTADQMTKVTDDEGNEYYTDLDGNRVQPDEKGNFYRVDSNDNFQYDLKINGVSVGAFSKDSTLEDVMSAINRNTEVGVDVSFSRITNQLQFTARDTGSAGSIEMDEGLAQVLFGNGTQKAGQDAVLSMSVNGVEYQDISRSSNSFDVDGMTINLKGSFGYEGDNLTATAADAVTFTTTTDADKIIDVVKQMVEDYNAMADEIKKAYSTMPAEQSNGDRYMPLTDEDRADMSETAISNYEAKAKQGILFGDRDLSNLYNSLTSAIQLNGEDGAILRSIGLTVSYSDGMSTLTLDEEKLRSALESDPDKVKDVFTKSTTTGAESNGLMQSLRNTLDTYAKTTGTKGILVQRAGTELSSTSLLDNELLDRINNYEDQIERWETKLSDQIDRYTSQFSMLEQMVAQMNSQSSMLSGLMGG